MLRRGGDFTLLEQLRAALQGEEGEEGGVCESARGGLVIDTAEMRDTPLRRRHLHTLVA
jgi:hypothetical protein